MKRRYKADPTAMFRLFNRIKPLDEAFQTDLTLPVRTAYDSLLNRTATEADFHTVAAAMNIVLVCAEKINAEVEAAAKLAVDAMFRVKERHDSLGVWGLDGPARGEILTAIEVYEQLASLLTGGQLKTAMTEVYQRMDLQIEKEL